MLENWPIVPLKDLCEDFKKDIVDGPFGSNLKREHYTEEGVPVLKIQNIKPFEIKLHKMDYVSEEKAEELNRHSFQKGDIIMTKLGDPLGVSAIVEELDEGIIVADLVRIRAQKINTKFLCYQLNSPKIKAHINSLQKGTTRPRVRITIVRDIPIVVPPLEEQQRIVRILDEAFSRLNKCGIQLLDKTTSAENILQSTIFFELNKDSQGWSESELDKICLNITDGSHNPPKGVESSEYRMLSSRNVFNDSINFEKFRFITEEDYEKEHKRTKVESGDILLTIVGTIGRCAVVNEESLPFTLQRSVAIMKPNTQIIQPRFLMYSLMNISSSLNEQSRGAAQKGIYLKQLRKFPIQYPDLETQLSIVKKLDQISKLANQVVGNYDLGYVSLSELKQSILQEAFSGKLTGGIVA